MTERKWPSEIPVPGKRAVMTVLGYERLIRPWTHHPKARITQGLCIKTEYPLGVVILRDDHKRPEYYHIDFWEKAR